MRRENVKSTSIRSLGHDGTTLEVEFHNGSLFRYTGVPGETIDKLKKARSLGQYFTTHIRDRFPCERVVRSQR